jgi:hypothetical protein
MARSYVGHLTAATGGLLETLEGDLNPNFPDELPIWRRSWSILV